MEEGQVTVDGVTHPLPRPITVIATQNPTGAAGTQLLPDSQMDRFTVRLSVGYPKPKDELDMVLARQGGVNPLNAVRQVVTAAELVSMQEAVGKIYMKESLIAYVVSLVSATRQHPQISRGASPRATLAIVSMAKATAYMNGRDYVLPEDVQTVFVGTVSHRILLSNEAQNLGLTYNNYGRNGSCVAFDRTHDGKFNFGPAMWVRYKDMDPTADYVIILAGHNDADKVKDNPDSLRMFRDSLEVLIQGIEQLCPKAKIGYVTPWYVDRPGFKAVCKTIQKVCKRHHIPVLCNYTSKCVIQVRDEAFRRQYFQGPNDTAHLNAAGHDLFLPVGTAWFKKYMQK
jgi:hypothetical protein